MENRNNENNENGLTFRMYLDVRMNRPMDRERDFVGFDGATMVMNGRWMTFDFEEMEGSVDEDSPDIVHLVCKNPDCEYEDTDNITKDDLMSVSEITDITIDTNMDGLYPAGLLSCTFVLPYEGWEKIAVPEQVCGSYRFAEAEMEAER